MVFAEDVSYYVATYANKDCALLTLPGDLFPSACQKLLEERLPEDLANLSIEIHRLWKQGITKSSDAMISGHLLILSEIRSYLDSIIPAKSVGE